MVLLLLACAANPPGTDVPAMPTYTQDVAPIVEEHCLRCHVTGGPRRGGVVVDSYEVLSARAVINTCVSVNPDVVDAHADSLLPLAGSQDLAPCESWDVFSMPPGAMPRLTEDEQWILARWTAIGAPE